MRNVAGIIWLSCVLVSLHQSLAFAGLREQAQGYREDGLDAQRHDDIPSAIAFYQKAIHLDPGFAVAYNDLGVAYERQGDLPLALQAYERALSLDPNYLEASANLGSLHKRLGSWTEALPRLLKAAVLLEQRGDLDASKRFYQDVLDMEPNHFEGLGGLAGVYARLGERTQAVTTWVKLALLYEQRGQLDAAKSVYERAIALEAGSVEVTSSLALVCERLGQRDQAVFYWNTVGGLYEQRGDVQTARRSYERALDLNPNNAETLAKLAVASEQLGERDRAVSYWLKCQQLSSPNDPWRLRAEERLIELGLVKTGPVYRGHLVQQEFHANTRSREQFRMVTEQERW